MLNKLITFLIRAGVFAIVGYSIGVTLENIGFDGEVSLSTAIIIWCIGVLYSSSKFNKAYNFGFANNTESKIITIMDNKNKQRIENEMIRVKELFDADILTESEYNEKIRVLKDKYL